MGLAELKPFDPKEKIIELKIDSTAQQKSLVQMNLRQFCNETLSDSPAPGGGSVAALMGVNTDRIISFTFVVGSSLAGVGSVLVLGTCVGAAPLLVPVLGPVVLSKG